ncbi:helix-turn-helix transcriptional regulator [Rhodococcus sp. NPDC060090]|uniref:helix-turn-helix transcriptional regulator n=1 Tax=Rhodococcus sp. NPDC060090 TaxID=3347056 RepID=UPI00364ED814
MAHAALPETCAPPESSSQEPLLWIGAGRATYLGPSLELAPHSTSVHCVIVGVDDLFTLRVEGAADLVTRSALVPPRVVHQVISPPGSRILFCYSDVTMTLGRDHASRMALRQDLFWTDHRDEAALVRLCRGPVSDGAAIATLATGPRHSDLDPRIVRTVRRIHSDAPLRRNASDLARAEHLSTSHFSRLFGRETGTSFGRYRLWVRMLHVARSISDGNDFTSAAMSAGFASPSHFSDSFLRMFGLTATSLATTGTNIVVDDAALSPTATATRAAPPSEFRDDR